MKKLNNIFTLLVVALVGLSLTACSNDDLSTDQYTSDGVSLLAFGPTPVLRGGTLFFHGTNLDRITEIQLPGQTISVTNINVAEGGKHSRISITVPAEGGTEGHVTLKANDGTTLTTVSKLTFREDISISKIYIGTEGNLNGEVGDILTIEGDYLNLMRGVIFSGGFTVSDFEEHTRYKIAVKIPKEAASGKVTLTDLAEMPTELQASEEITIKLPVATATAVNQKAGSLVTINGTDLNQIQTILLQGGVTIAEENITRAEDGTNLSFTLPEAAADGDITLVTYSGQKISAGTLTTVTPTGLAISGSVKNGLQMTVTGTNMDLVKAVAFEKAGDYSGQLTVTADKIVIAKVPDAAQDGNLTLKMQNGKTVTIAYTLAKPTVTSADPATVTAGEETVIYGTNLDLVAAITFPGDTEVTVEAKDFTAQEADGIQVAVPAACSGTGMKLLLKNETEVTISGILTINTATNPAISEAPASAVAGDVITITGKNFNNLANLYIGTYKVTRYTSKSNTSLTFKVPDAPVGDYKFVMEDYDGNKFNGPAFSVAAAEFTIWEGNADNMNSWNNIEGVGSDAGTELKAAGAEAGWVLRFYGEFSSSWFEMRVIEGHWGDTYHTFTTGNDKDGCCSMELTQTMLDNALTQKWWGGTFIVSGQGFILKKVTVAKK